MLDTTTITSTSAAFVAGLVTSIHCVGMCGPLACAFGKGPADANGRYASLAVYHSTRILSYGLIGALAGLIGQAPLSWFHESAAHYLPWVLVVFFLLIAFGVENRIPKPAFVSRWLFRIRLRTSKMNRYTSASILGLATPAMPCGPLYLVFAVAMTTGSALRGFEFLTAFALGTLPLLGAFHAGVIGFRERLNPVWMNRLQRGLALLVAVIFALRLTVGSTRVEAAAPNPDGTPAPMEASCPMCH